MKECTGFLESYHIAHDASEGAGLGIHMVYFLLKNAGIDPSVFTITSQDHITTSRFSVPFRLRPSRITHEIKEKILKEVEILPTLPLHIIDLIRLCREPECKMSDIIKKISPDASLTADILKLANSAFIGYGKKIDNVDEALSVIGTSNLEILLLTAGSRQILTQRYSTFESVWNHCQKTALYASVLAKKYRLNKIAGNVYLAGLLHDLGKIILLSLGEDITNKIADIVSNRAIRDTTLVEEISIGISHSTIGALIAKKWNFPEHLVETINKHHSPLNVPPEMKEQMVIVYLANMLCGIEDDRYKFSYIEDEVLRRFDIRNDLVLKKILDDCKASLQL